MVSLEHHVFTRLHINACILETENEVARIHNMLKTLAANKNGY